MKVWGLILTMTVSAALAAPQQSGAIAGKILHSDGTPAVGVRVVAVDATKADTCPKLPLANLKASRTDGSGRFRLENLPAGAYHVAAGVEGYSRRTEFCPGGYFIREPSYFPGGYVRKDATLVSVRSDAVADAEFRLLTAPTITTPGFTVRGRVISDAVDGIASTTLDVVDRDIPNFEIGLPSRP